MSRILARSVTADLCGRLFNRLLFIVLLPFIVVLAFLPARGVSGPIAADGRLAPVAVKPRAAVRAMSRSLVPQGDLKSLP